MDILSLKSIHCSSALAKNHGVTGQTNILWSDPKNRGWKAKVPYKFSLQHRPKSGKIRLEMYEASTKLFDTGKVIIVKSRRGRFLWNGN